MINLRIAYKTGNFEHGTSHNFFKSQVASCYQKFECKQFAVMVKAELIRSLKELINISEIILKTKPAIPSPPTALQPAVNSWPSIISVSKELSSARTVPNCYTVEVLQPLLSHIPPIQALVFQLADCNELSFRNFLSIRTGGSLRTCPALYNLLNLMQEF